MMCATCRVDKPWRAFAITREGGIADLARWCESCRARWRARRPSSPRALGTNPRARGTNPRAQGSNPRAQEGHIPARPARVDLEELLGPLEAARRPGALPGVGKSARRYPDTRPRYRRRRRQT